MGTVREHDPVIIEEINGLWDRGDPETCPTDHLLVADNINFLHSGVRTRTAVAPYMGDYRPELNNLLRVRNYVTQTSQSLIALQYYQPPAPFPPPFPEDPGNPANGPGPPRARFLHIKNFGQGGITEIGDFVNVHDFAMIVIAGRAYISPFHYRIDSAGNYYALGTPDQYVLVYNGTGVMRLAAGPPPTNASGTPSDGGKKPFIVYNEDIDGSITKGYHAFSVAFVNPSEGAIQMSLRPVADAPGGKVIRLINIPIGPPGTTGRVIAMTKAIIPFAPGQDNKMYRVIGIPDNTTTSFIIDIGDAGLTTEYIPQAGPAPPVNAMFITQTPDNGFADTGLHLFGVVYETDTGYLTPPGPEFFTAQTLVDSTKKIEIINVPIGPSNVVKRHIVATKWIPDYYTGDQKGYQFFFVPKATIENNTATTLKFDFYDSDLVSDASHLFDNYTSIPACVNFCQYHSRLVMVGFSDFPKKVDGITNDTSKGDNRCVALLSAPGEPEAVNKIDGVIVTPLDGKPLQNCEQFRDILYLFKASKTYAYSDNNDEPVTWVEEVLDQGVGTQINGIAEVLDSGGVNIDYLLVAHYSGLLLFNGTYARPELTWKVEDLWLGQGRDRFVRVQVVNDSIGKKLWILPGDSLDRILYHIDYSNGLDPKGIRFSRWTFQASITSILLINTDELIVTMISSNTPQPISDLLVRPGNQVIVDGRIIWDDEQVTYPPLPPITQVAGAIMIGRRANSTVKHDEYFNEFSSRINLPIQGRIRTAYLGD